MTLISVVVVGLVAVLVGQVEAARQCAWLLPRANVIRDTLYLDGGYFWTQEGSNRPNSSGNFEGLVYSLNFSEPFATNNSSVELEQSGLSHNLAPNYIDGAMFADDYEYALYGGLFRQTDSLPPPDDDDYLEYWKYKSNYSPDITFVEGYVQEHLPNGITREITSGAAVSVPSERIGFYFSGMRAPDWGPIFQNGTANITANTLISVDMTNVGSFNWTNSTLPEQIQGRANAEIVWLPISPKGVLVAIGGVINPEYILSASPLSIGGLTPSQIAESQKTSPGFMSTVSIYDIDSGKWYQQNTTTANGPSDMPPQLTQFCSTVAIANDSSSYNIYIYGGYAGLDSGTDVPSNDVYILSIPTFTWIKAYTGDNTKGRYGHRCVQPYPDQMFVIGGYGVGSPQQCFTGGTVQVFNLNTLSFQDSYDPHNWSYYEVPPLVTKVLGGDGKGGATNIAAKTWGDNALIDIFSTNYTGNPVNTWFPYVSTANSNTTALPPTVIKGSGGLPNWVAPVLGVVLGLVFLSALAVGWLLWRRRKNWRRDERNPSEAETYRNSPNPIVRWLHGMPPSTSVPKNDQTTMTSSEIAVDEKPRSPIASPTIEHPNNAFEMGGVPRYEVHGSSAIAELPTQYNTTQPTSPSSPHSLYSATSGLPSPLSPAQNPSISRGSSPDPSASPSQVPSRRPTHHRNASSVSSGPDLGPAVTEEEDRRRSRQLAELPSPGANPSPVSPLDGTGRRIGQGKVQSSFGEMLDENDEHGEK